MRRILASTRRALARFRRARDGAAALEFALIAPPFFLLIFALVEVTMMGFAQTSLDFAVSETSRRIRIGEVQTDGLTATALRSDMCETMNWILNTSCEGNLYLDVERYESYTDITNSNPISGGAFNDSNFGFQPGAPSDLIMVRAYYRWGVITPWFENFLANVSDGSRILTSSIMFRNEPFPVDPTS